MTGTKLEIIGPYTPEHEGPFCTRDGRPVRLITKEEGHKDYPVVGWIEGAMFPSIWRSNGDPYHKARGDSEGNINDLMNAREVPVAREFWVNKYKFRELSAAYPTKGMADSFSGRDRVECIHVREVLPGEGA